MQYICHIFLTSDTLFLADSILHQLKELVSYTTEKKEVTNPAIISLVSAIIGGILAISGQWIIKIYDSQTKKRNDLRQIIAKWSQLKTQLHFYFGSYACYEQNTEYQHLQYRLSTQDSEKQKILDEHYKSNLEFMSLHKQIIDLIAEFVGHASKFENISSYKISFKIDLESITEIQFGYGKSYESYTTAIADDQVSSDINELADKYREILSPFTAIISSMQHFKI